MGRSTSHKEQIAKASETLLSDTCDKAEVRRNDIDVNPCLSTNDKKEQLHLLSKYAHCLITSSKV